MLVLSPLLALALLLSPHAQEPKDDVRLVVVVSVDQLIPEQLERLRPHFRGGLRRFVEEGQVWRNAVHGHGVTHTGSGHATLGTGTHPSRHGIVANDWMAADTAGNVYCAGDEDARGLGSEGPFDGRRTQRSPKNMLEPGLADHLKSAFPQSKSIGIAAKDRAAILTAGRRPDWSLWWDRSGRGFVSSTYYGEELPAWVDGWNGSWTDAAKDGGLDWTSTLPEDLENTQTAPDERPGEYARDGSRTLPYQAPAFEAGDEPDPKALAALSGWVNTTPFVDAFVLQLAERAVEGHELGADEHPDYLFLGLSACDIVGHSYGPYSHEVTDVLLRVDRGLGRFFDMLDEKVGKDRWVAALSADHGVLPLPEWLPERGIEGGRIPGRDFYGALGRARTAVKELFQEDFILSFSLLGFRLSEEKMRAAGVDGSEVREAVAAAAMEELGMLHGAYTSDELAKAEDPLRVSLRKAYYPRRAADVLLVFKENYIVSDQGTTHGSPWRYDRAVPLVFLGPGSTPGVRKEPCETVSMLPTLLKRAGVPVPDGLDGPVLE